MEDDCTELDIDESDRVFNFEVSETNEQEENVAVVPGFKVCGALRQLFRLLISLSHSSNIESYKILNLPSMEPLIQTNCKPGSLEEKPTRLS